MSFSCYIYAHKKIVQITAVFFKETTSEVPCASVSERVLVQNRFYENKFDLYEIEPVAGTHFYMNDFARRLVLTQRRKETFFCYKF